MALSGKEAKEIVEYLPLHKVYLLKSAIVRIMAKNTGSQSMNGSAPGSSVAGRTRSSTVDNLDAIEQLQSLTAKAKVPAYMKQIIELLMETRKEVRDLSQRNADLLEELRLLRQENVSLKEKLASFERARATVTNPSHLTQPDVSVKVDLDLDRSIVLSHVPESSLPSCLRGCRMILIMSWSFLVISMWNVLPYLFIVWGRIRRTDLVS